MPETDLHAGDRHVSISIFLAVLGLT